MKLESLGLCLLVACVAAGCGEEARAPGAEVAPAVVRAARQAAWSDYNKVLILGSAVNGGVNSTEAQVVRAYRPSAQITVVTDAQWAAMSVNEFSQYHLIVIGDPGCVTGTEPFQAAVQNVDVWGPVVDSEVVIVGASTNAGGSQPLMQAGIHQALENGVQFFTSMYVSLGCAYRNAPANTDVPLLAPFGTFKVQGLPTCADTGHRFWTYPDLFSNEVFDESLTGANGCSTRTVFTQYPIRNLTAVAIATDSTGSNPIPGRQIYEDFYDGLNFDGTPYVFIRNTSAVGAGCGGDSNNIPSGEECDLGDGFNGQRGEGCSFTCRRNWCGNGVRDEGEECDNGINNQRTDTGDIVNGRCSALCKVINVPQGNLPPVALCRNVTVTVTNQCGMSANINNGSNDPEGEPITCTQSPTGPYNIGSTTVTLTCSDPMGQRASCTDVVTVVDGVKPVVTVLGLNPQPIECNRSANYAIGGFEPNPAATANDMCSGAVPVTKTGTVNMAAPGTYSRIYTATDAAGNSGMGTRTVVVSDTIKPVIITAGTIAPLECKVSTYTDVPPTATDQCVGPVAVTTTGSVNTNAVGSYVLTYTARDPSGNSADPRTRTVTVRDTQAPAITLQGSLAPPPVECGSAYADPGATASDVCAGALTAVPEPAVNPGQPNTYTVRYRATDPSGNSTLSSSARTVTVQDTLPPSLTLNGPATLGLECKATYTELGATANDQCTGTRPVTIAGTVNNVLVDTPQTVTYTANDGNGYSVNATRTVTVRDTQAPAITIQGSLTPPPVECGGGYTDPGATANDACAGVVAAMPTPPADPNAPGTYNVFYRATDPSGNAVTSTSSRTVTVQDTLAPVVTLNGAATQGLECASAYTELGATANDQCVGVLPVTIAGSVNNRQLGAQTLSYTANDGSGHTGSKTRTVNVSDTLAPSITLNGPLNMLVECGDSTYADPGATASDQCAGAVPAVPVSPANPNQPNTYTVRYRATDPSGNSALSSDSRTMTVQDTLLPTLNLAGANPQVVECGTAWADPGAAASDQCAGALTPTVSGGVNHLVPADYSVTYTVNDGQPGHTVTRTRAVNVRDTLPPSITVNGPVNDSVSCGSTYLDPGATATDVCDANVEVNATQTGSASTPGTFTISYTARDDAGHAVTSPVSRSVMVNDDAPPSLMLLGSAAQVLECPTPFVEPSYTANDACYGDVTNRVQVTGSVNAGTPGNYTLTYNVTDLSGQSAPALTRSVRVQDTQRPQVMVNGPLDQQFACGSTYVDPGATANDACAGSVPVTATQSGSANQPGTFTISYTATDPSNNQATSPVTRTVHVNDDLPPTLALVGPAVQRLECGSSFVDPGATANDACFGDLTSAITVSGTVNAGSPRDYTLLYNVTDGAGNSAPSVSRMVEVRDTLVPTITVTGPTNTTYECGTTYADPGATATDACAGNLTSAIVATQTPDPNAPANFTVTYRVTDPSGNTTVSPVTRTVTVNDNTAPSIALNGPAVQNLECAPTAYNDLGATAIDSCSVNPQVTVVGSVDMTRNGTYTLTYTASDLAGNTSPSVSRTVNISDTTPPSITLNGANALTLECEVDTYTELGATGTDICSGSATISVDGTVDTQNTGFYLVRYTATDASGNTHQTKRDVHVQDTTGPVLTVTGAPVAEIECGSQPDLGVVAADACYGPVAVTASLTQLPRALGEYDVTYSATDPAGNTTKGATRRFMVVDTLEPNIVCPEPITVHGDTDAEADVTPGQATATDACDTAVSISGPTETRFPIGETVVTYTATDDAGNTASCTSTITVVPPPVAEEVDRDLLGGAGCSSASGSPSTLGWMGAGILAALLIRKHKQRRLPVLAVLLLGSRAFAQLEGVPSFELELLKLNPSATGSLVLGTGELLQAGDYRFSLTTHYENDPLVLFINGTEEGVLVRHRATAHLAAAYGAWGWLELGAQVPVLLLQRGDDLRDHDIGQPESGPAPGTPLLTVRVKLLSQREDSPVDLAFGAHVGPAVGSGLALAREPRALPSLMVGRQFPHLRAALDAGILLRPRTTLNKDKHIRDELGHALRFGGTLSTLGSGLRGELALTGSVPLSQQGASIEALAGARLPVSSSVEAYAMAGLAAGTAPGTPDFRLLLGVAYGRTQPARAEVRTAEPEVLSPPPDGAAVEKAVEPAKDSDSDGIQDEDDACPTEPGIPEMHGCPAQDTDQDTVLDHVDNCPDAAGPPANQGCPEEQQQLVALQKNRIEIRDTVHFDFDRATIQPRSFPLLDQVGRLLVEHPEILSVTIEGHTDGRGSAEYNRNLSQRRAEAVRDYLAQQGVARSRMQARGFGEDRPLQSNATDEGRAANRRVEFITRYTP